MNPIHIPKPYFPKIRPIPRPFVTFRNVFPFLRWGVVSPPPNPQAGGPPLVGCPRLIIQYIRSYPPYLEAFSSIRNLRTRHAVVTRDPLNLVRSTHLCDTLHSPCAFLFLGPYNILPRNIVLYCSSRSLSKRSLMFHYLLSCRLICTNYMDKLVTFSAYAVVPLHKQKYDTVCQYVWLLKT
jgi:hypothetical protein